MVGRLVLYSTCFAFALVPVLGQLQTVNGRIKITVGTTSACSDTMNFIPQLAEVYNLYGNYLDLEFIPWGRTIWNETGIACQFGVNDCWANRLHRCVLDQLRGNQAAQMHYMNCEFSAPYPAYAQGTYLCAQAVGLRLIEVDYCVNHPGDELDRAAQVASEEPMSVINFVPSIHFNDNIDVDLHNEARTRLRSLVCFALAADPSTSVFGCTL